MAVVLVVNDDNDMLDMYASMLSSLGHQPITRETVASGPETVRDVGADALVVDLQRPNDDEYGLRLIEGVRADEEMRAIPIVLCTGATDALESLRPRLDALAVPIVVKPFSIDELEQTLSGELKRSADR